MLPPVRANLPFNITRASHLSLTSRDLARSRDFYTEVIGLKVSNETATSIHFRGVEECGHHSLTLRKTREQGACERVGFRMFAEEELDAAKAHFEAKGILTKFVNLPFQGRTLHVTGLAGAPLEFCARMKTFARAHARTHEHRGAAAMRLDHFQLMVPDVASSLAFYAECGFRISGYASVGARIAAALLHRKDNPHDLVLQEGDGPRLQHFGFIVQETHHLMRALDAAGHLGFAAGIEYGPGRHGYSHRLYLRDPDGHRIALLLPPIQVIDADDEPVRCDVQAREKEVWAPAPPPTWFEEATRFAGVAITSPARAGAPVAAGLDLFAGRLGFQESGSAYLPEDRPAQSFEAVA